MNPTQNGAAPLGSNPPVWGQQPPTASAGGFAAPAYGAEPGPIPPAGAQSPVVPGATGGGSTYPVPGAVPAHLSPQAVFGSAPPPGPFDPAKAANGPVAPVAGQAGQFQPAVAAQPLPAPGAAGAAQPASPVPQAGNGAATAAANPGQEGLKHAVQEARRIMEDPQGNPYRQAKAFERLKAEYLNTYRNQSIKISQD